MPRKNSRAQARMRKVSRQNIRREPRTVLREFPRSLPMALLRGREAVMRYFRPSLHEHGLTDQQWRALRALAYTGPIEVAELAHLTFLLGPSLSRILRDLNQRGLIERRSVKKDLRRTVISISRSGRRLIRVVAPQSEAAYAAIRRRVGARRLEALYNMLREMEESLLAGLPQHDSANSGRAIARFAPHPPRARATPSERLARR
jgi:homoprotocatechuate degradation regulator HpaR